MQAPASTCSFCGAAELARPHDFPEHCFVPFAKELSRRDKPLSERRGWGPLMYFAVFPGGPAFVALSLYLFGRHTGLDKSASGFSWIMAISTPLCLYYTAIAMVDLYRRRRRRDAARILASIPAVSPPTGEPVTRRAFLHGKQTETPSDAVKGRVERIDQTISSFLFDSSCVAVELTFCDDEGDRVYLRRARSVDFLVVPERASEGAEPPPPVVVAGAVSLQSLARLSTADDLPYVQAKVCPGFDWQGPKELRESQVRIGDHVTVYGQAKPELHPKLARGYRDDGQVATLRGRPGAPVVVVVSPPRGAES